MENPGKFAAQKNGRLQSVIEHSDIQCDPKWRFRLNSVFDNFLLKHVPHGSVDLMHVANGF